MGSFPLLLSGGFRPIAGADFRGGALPPNVTLTRASAGTFWNSFGTLVDVGNDVARFDHQFPAFAPLGLLLEGSSRNLVTNPRAEGASFPSTNPTGWTIPTLIRASITPQTIRGISGIAVRYQGTPTGTSAQTLAFGGVVEVAGFHRASIYARLLAGSLNNVSGDGGTIFRIAATGASTAMATRLIATLTSGELDFFELTRNSAVAAGVNLRWNYLNTVDPVDFTLWVGAPQLEVGTITTSRIFPPVGSPASATRAADSALLSVANGTYDVLTQDAAGGAWSPGVVVSGGTYTITPRAGRVSVRRVTVWPAGYAALYPSWAKAI